MTIPIIGAILIIPLVLLLNILFFHLLIKRAVTKFVKPELERNRLKFIDYKWAGFFGCGDFKNDKTDFALFKTGPNSISIYSFIYYEDLDTAKRITIKVNVLGLNIQEVLYSAEL